MCSCSNASRSCIGAQAARSGAKPVLVGFYEALRTARVPVALREWLDLMAALDADFAFADPSAFFHLARTVLVKDERHYDKFERAFVAYFTGVAAIDTTQLAQIPADWLRESFKRLLSEEEKARLAALGGLDRLLEEFRKRLAEQKERHAGGSRWIGTGGTSPFGAGGTNPLGMRVGPRGGGRSAVKVWEQRNFRALDGDADLSPRNFKLALRRLRRFAREGAAEEFDLDATIDATAREAMLDIRLRPERHNAIKVLLLLDIGGSMDDHIAVCEALFGAAKSEFKRLEYFYFHNFIYGELWRDHQLRMSERIATTDLLRRYNNDYKVIFVGDAAMAPYEITHVGGGIDDFSGSGEPGAVWFRRVMAHFRKVVWLNPTPREQWGWTQSNALIRELVEDRMYPLTPDGLTEATRWLAK
jgi:uncharacterized protein with von Willebrand factor type A (vWA) domain